MAVGRVHEMMGARRTIGTSWHSEHNASHDESVHLLQLWIEPDTLGLRPSYEQKPLNVPSGQWCVVASPQGGTHAVHLHAPVRILLAHLQPGQSLQAVLPKDRQGWLHVASGDSVRLENESVTAGDAAALPLGETVRLQADSAAQLLLFEVPLA